MTNHNGSRPPVRSAAGFSTASGGIARPLPRTRWVDWVRALASRWSCGFERNDRLALILLRPVKVARRVRERWLLKSQRFYPKINLNVQVFLRATGPTVFGLGGSRDFVLVDRRFQVHEPVKSLERGIPPPLASSVESSAYQTTDRERRTTGRIEVLSPLERVLERRESVIDTREAAGSVRIEAILDRLTQRSDRIETRLSTSVMTTTRLVGASSISQSRALAAEADTTDAQARIPGADVLSQPRMNRDPDFEQSRWHRSEPGMSIERITDQVIRRLDRRVVAARERIGANLLNVLEATRRDRSRMTLMGRIITDLIGPNLVYPFRVDAYDAKR